MRRLRSPISSSRKNWSAEMSWRLRQAGAADAAALSLVASATFLETYAGLIEGAGYRRLLRGEQPARKIRCLGD